MISILKYKETGSWGLLISPNKEYVSDTILARKHPFACIINPSTQLGGFSRKVCYFFTHSKAPELDGGFVPVSGAVFADYVQNEETALDAVFDEQVTVRHKGKTKNISAPRQNCNNFELPEDVTGQAYSSSGLIDALERLVNMPGDFERNGESGRFYKSQFDLIAAAYEAVVWDEGEQHVSAVDKFLDALGSPDGIEFTEEGSTTLADLVPALDE